VIETTMDAHKTQPCSSIEAVLEADRWARSHAERLTESADGKKAESRRQ